MQPVDVQPRGVQPQQLQSSELPAFRRLFAHRVMKRMDRQNTGYYLPDDWILWQLAQKAIGGDLAGRLWKLRQDEGLAYSVWLFGGDSPRQPITSVYMATAGDKREAALAAPVSRRTLSPILAGLRAGIRPEVERILLHKLHQIHPSLVRYLVDLLVEGSWGEEALRGLFASLPQMALFELFLDTRHPAAWALVDTESTRFWQRLVRLASDVLVAGPGRELLRHLLSRSGDDEAFARRHGSFLRDAVRRADANSGADLVGHVERLTFGASEEKVARLAQSLVDLSTRLDGAAVDKVHTLLEQWKSRSADLKLKIYHLEQGIG